MKPIIFPAVALMLGASVAHAAKPIVVASPDGRIEASVVPGDSLTFSVSYDGTTLIEPSTIAMKLSDGTVVGPGKVKVKKRAHVSESLKSPLYRATEIPDEYNSLTLKLSPEWDVVFRAYNDGVAYRFVTTKKSPFEVADEVARFRFSDDTPVVAPYANTDDSSFERQFRNSFENTYTSTTLGELNPRRLIFLPMVVEPSGSAKVLITESALENYPGMFLNTDAPAGTLNGIWAPRPSKLKQGGHNNLQMLVTERENYIAKVDGPRAFPWRIAVVAPEDKVMAETNLSYILGEPSRLDDVSWIKPGKVAWDWWNDWNLYGVNFKTGVNNDTYKAYIDFASRNGIEYVILDEGWAVNKKADLMQVVPEIDLPMLARYAESKGVGLILWAGYQAFAKDMENVCKHYADMGIKGFKVDFMDRDDQIITDFYYKAAEIAARHKMMLDFHGTSKPAGLNRTWPNVVNFEGVNGLEQMKWASTDLDQVKYDVQIPFIRQAAGPMDYTQGAMRNATKRDYRPVYDDPMSQGTRCRQLALYMVFDSPLNMMCDTPSNYEAESECTAFIAGVPTVWDETRIIDGKLGEYIVTARRLGDKWYVGGITDWTPRDLQLDLSFMGPGNQVVELFADGINADRNARDYTKKKVTLTDGKLNIHLAPGGGFALRSL